MSIYSIDFAGISSGWYRKTTDENYTTGRKIIDKHWNFTCDLILIKFVEKYGTFFPVFYKDIIEEIDSDLQTELEKNVRYYEYYLATRACQIKKTKKIWIDSYKSNMRTSYICPYCGKKFLLLDCHSEILRTLGIPPTHCRTCNYIVGRYDSFWSEEIKLKVYDLMHDIDRKKDCELCSKEYVLANDIFTYNSFGKQFVDFFYPNLFFNICPKCFKKIFNDYKRGASKLKLSRLYELFIFTGKIPTQDFEKIIYLYKDRESLMKLINIFHKLRSPQGYKEEFGSFFGALVKSGILPKGSKKMTYGIMSLAADGHLCLSLAEKEIDDFLYSKGIAHEKEVFYPDSKMRTDWEILDVEKRTFVEYFGLMSNKDYAEKTENKIKWAESNNINLIEIYPDSDWESLLSTFIVK